MKQDQPRSSRQRYRVFVQDYKHGRLDDAAGADEKRRADDAAHGGDSPATGAGRRFIGGARRQYLRNYLRWLWPHRYAVGVVFLLALLAAGLEMIEPLFMRFIVDRVLLNAELDMASRLARLQMAGAVFLGVVVISSSIDAL